jgi:hypothetical protein
MEVTFARPAFFGAKRTWLVCSRRRRFRAIRVPRPCAGITCNYLFVAGGQDLVLRMAKRFRSLRTPTEALESVPREAETLRRLANCRSPFRVPKLVCTVADDAGRTVGLIESCLDGTPLSRFQGGVTVPARR